MQITSAKAKPIEQEGRYLILLFGPDRELKAIASHARARFPGHTVNIRSTDNPLDAYAEHTPCSMRIIIDNPQGRSVAKLYEESGLSFTLMSWNGSELAASDGKAEELTKTTASDLPILRLSNGTVIERGPALERAAKAMGMSLAAFSALDEKTILGAVEVAIGMSEQSTQQKKRGRPRKADAQSAQSTTDADSSEM